MKRFIILVFIGFLAAALLMTSAAEAVVVTYGYDGAGRLTSADYGFGKCVAYRYDAAGNLLEEKTTYSLSDVIRILRVVVAVGADVSLSGGDIDSDGKIGLAEAIYLLQTLSGMRP